MTDSGVSKVNWTLLVYPWDTQYPTEKGDSTRIDTAPITSGDTAGVPGEVVNVNKGVTFMSFSRSKDSHDNVLSIQIQGQVHPSILIGNWVSLKSNAKLAPTGDLQKENETLINQVANYDIPRFIGQITNITPSYDRTQDGNLVQSTTVIVHEWSYVFDLAIRYDESVIVSGLADSPEHELQVIQKQNNLTSEQLGELATERMNPFKYVHLIMSLIGGLSSDESLLDSSMQDIKLHALALRLPVIPKTLLDDLGISGSSELSLVNPSIEIPTKSVSDSGDNSFSSGFSTTITGVLKEPLHNDGNWDGLFEADEIKSMATGRVFNKNPAGRPVASGLPAMLSQGLSTWSLIQNMCDPDFNEVFTDMLYERSKDGKSIITRPVLWVRDKPFAVKKVFNQKDLSSAEWTKYDDLPRLYIPSIYIEKLMFTTDINNAINYIKLEFLAGVVTGDVSKVLSALKGTIRNKPAEMLRYGGHEMFARTNFISQDFIAAEQSGDLASAVDDQAASILSGDVGMPEWFSQLRDILDVWWGSYHKMPRATMYIKDCNVPISVGLNVTWVLGGIQFVGHVNSVSSTILVDEAGLHTTETVISLDRVMKTIDDPVEVEQEFGTKTFGFVAFGDEDSDYSSSGSSGLDFVLPTKINNLFHDYPESKKKDVSKELSLTNFDEMMS